MNNKKIIAALCLVGFVCLLVAPMVAIADSAVVIRDFDCGVLDANNMVVTVEGRISVRNDGGHTTLVCRGRGVTNDTGRAVRLDFGNTGRSCFTAGGPTTDWHNIVSRSGNVTLVCRNGLPVAVHDQGGEFTHLRMNAHFTRPPRPQPTNTYYRFAPVTL